MGLEALVRTADRRLRLEAIEPDGVVTTFVGGLKRLPVRYRLTTSGAP